MNPTTQPQLSALLPIHAARERRRMQQYQAASHSHELALSAEREAARTLAQLKQRQQETLAAALVADAADHRGLNAAEAHAALQYVDVLAGRARQAQSRLQQQSGAAVQSAAALAAAQQAYAEQVRVHQLLQEGSTVQCKRLVRQLGQREEQWSEECFLSVWTVGRN